MSLGMLGSALWLLAAPQVAGPQTLGGPASPPASQALEGTERVREPQRLQRERAEQMRQCRATGTC
jgi:hypothetical protein